MSAMKMEVRKMRRILGVLAMLVASAAMTLAVACSGDSRADVDETSSAATSAAVVEALTAVSAATAQMSSSMAQAQPSGGQTGILVSGEGRVSVEPDLAIVNIGVEAQAETVAEARGDAAGAMTGVVAAVRNRGLSDADIQTTSFNIWPQYQYEEIERDGRRVNRQVLVGYTVSNSAAIKVRDLSALGPIIDEVAEAGGDFTRINGVSFTVEDTKPFMDDLRAAAFEEAEAKASQLADLAGVELGQAMFISEGAATPDVVRSDLAFRAVAMESKATPISAGETELRLTISALFGIGQ